jgi:hypothetical protein
MIVPYRISGGGIHLEGFNDFSGIFYVWKSLYIFNDNPRV